MENDISNCVSRARRTRLYGLNHSCSVHSKRFLYLRKSRDLQRFLFSERRFLTISIFSCKEKLRFLTILFASNSNIMGTTVVKVRGPVVLLLGLTAFSLCFPFDGKFRAERVNHGWEICCVKYPFRQRLYIGLGLGLHIGLSNVVPPIKWCGVIVDRLMYKRRECCCCICDSKR